MCAVLGPHSQPLSLPGLAVTKLVQQVLSRCTDTILTEECAKAFAADPGTSADPDKTDLGGCAFLQGGDSFE